jgi:hypothetical protein
MLAVCDTTLMRVSPALTRPEPKSVPFVHSLYLDYGTQRKQWKTARDLAVFPIAEPPAAQDFRGERDVVC